jgi:hypothetical protein
LVVCSCVAAAASVDRALELLQEQLAGLNALVECILSAAGCTAGLGNIAAVVVVGDVVAAAAEQVLEVGCTVVAQVDNTVFAAVEQVESTAVGMAAVVV